MSESTRYFQGNSGLHETLVELTKRFEAHGISYVVIGGVALTVQGQQEHSRRQHPSEDQIRHRRPLPRQR